MFRNVKVEMRLYAHTARGENWKDGRYHVYDSCHPYCSHATKLREALKRVKTKALKRTLKVAKGANATTV